MITIAETTEYFRLAKKLLDEEDQRNIVDYLGVHPKAGEIIQGSGGIRKLRWKRDSKGKRGGVRVIIIFILLKPPSTCSAFLVKAKKKI